ncbi:MAG: hypothetical protein U9O94_07965 [Nanoarchaeota archaeon]|nr:hypothetical protein [Nanoarchaeota archaeon]
MLVGIGVSSSFAQKVVKTTLAVDTLNGAETVNFAAVEVTRPFASLTIQALCTQVGGTSDGKVTVQGSIDGTSYVTLANLSNNGWVSMFAADSSKVANDGNEFTITNGGVFTTVISPDNGATAPFLYFRLRGVGTTGDTTKLNIKSIVVK